MSREEFVATFGRIFQGPTDVVGRAFDRRPFADTANLRAAFNYVVYYAPDSGDASKTQVAVPDNLRPTPGDSHLHQEIALRLAATL